jgi:putative transposase
VVDTLGLLLMVVVHSAGIQDPAGAKLVLGPMATRFPRLSLIWADNIYKGPLVGWVWYCLGWVLDIVKRNEQLNGFQVQKWRWVVERTFAWLGRYRRLSKDYEFHTTTSETMIYMAMSFLMARRLARA